ncbi:MAG: hypothetical protein K0R41_2927 [Geminicoccaceae bacterium]|jgi:hypothetical protein|nr:hypothetical protein [Geminicoccaceae bacterium]MCE3249102.1 hypothetical protein [Geminicoccaceae bacterium]
MGWPPRHDHVCLSVAGDLQAEIACLPVELARPRVGAESDAPVLGDEPSLVGRFDDQKRYG